MKQNYLYVLKSFCDDMSSVNAVGERCNYC